MSRLSVRSLPRSTLLNNPPTPRPRPPNSPSTPSVRTLIFTGRDETVLTDEAGSTTDQMGDAEKKLERARFFRCAIYKEPNEKSLFAFSRSVLLIITCNRLFSQHHPLRESLCHLMKPNRHFGLAWPGRLLSHVHRNHHQLDHATNDRPPGSWRFYQSTNGGSSGHGRLRWVGGDVQGERLRWGTLSLSPLILWRVGCVFEGERATSQPTPPSHRLVARTVSLCHACSRCFGDSVDFNERTTWQRVGRWNTRLSATPCLTGVRERDTESQRRWHPRAPHVPCPRWHIRHPALPGDPCREVKFSVKKWNPIPSPLHSPLWRFVVFCFFAATTGLPGALEQARCGDRAGNESAPDRRNGYFRGLQRRVFFLGVSPAPPPCVKWSMPAWPCWPTTQEMVHGRYAW